MSWHFTQLTNNFKAHTIIIKEYNLIREEVKHMNLDYETELKTKTKDFFDKLAVSYDNSRTNALSKVFYNDIIRRILDLKPETLLDVGCGDGSMLALLSHQDIALYGIDLSKKMIAAAQKKLVSNAEVCVGDTSYLPYADNSFDLIVCSAVLHYIPRPKSALKEFKRVLTPSGTLILGIPTAPIKMAGLSKIQFDWNHPKVHLYNRKKLEALLRSISFSPYHWTKPNYRSIIVSATVTK